MDTTTISAFDICQLRKVIAQALKLPKLAVIGSGEPENALAAFITVDLTHQQQIGQTRRTFDGDREIEILTRSLLSTVSISCYGNQGVAMASKLNAVLHSSKFSQQLRQLHASVVRCSEVRDLTSTVGADYQERGQFDCVLSHHHIIETPLERIEQVETSGVIRRMIGKVD